MLFFLEPKALTWWSHPGFHYRRRRTAQAENLCSTNQCSPTATPPQHTGEKGPDSIPILPADKQMHWHPEHFTSPQQSHPTLTGSEISPTGMTQFPENICHVEACIGILARHAASSRHHLSEDISAGHCQTSLCMCYSSVAPWHGVWVPDWPARSPDLFSSEHVSSRHTEVNQAVTTNCWVLHSARFRLRDEDYDGQTQKTLLHVTCYVT